MTGQTATSETASSALPAAPKHASDPRAGTRGSLGIGVAMVILVPVIWALSRLPGIIGFTIAQHRQHLPANWSQLLARWDGFWYVYLAQNGYPPTLDLPGRPYYGPWGFFPFWPWTIRLISTLLGGHVHVAAAIATAVYGLLVLAAVWCAAHFVAGRGAALGTTLLVAFFPGSLSLTMPYTEGSFVFWSIIVLLAVGMGGTARSASTLGASTPASGPLSLWSRPGWLVVVAAVASFLACGTRSTGVAVLAAVAVHAVIVAVRTRRVPWGDLVIGAAGVLGMAVDLVYADRRTGNPFIWKPAQAQWHQTLDFGRGLWVAFTQTIPAHGPDYRTYTIMLAMTGVLVAAVIVAAISWRRIPLTWWVYTVVLLALTLLWSTVGPRPRLLFALVPIFAAVAVTLLRWGVAGRILLGLLVAGSAVASVVYAYAVFYVPWHVTA